MASFTLPPDLDKAQDKLSQVWEKMSLIPHAWKGPLNQTPLSVENRILGDYEVIMVRRGEVKLVMTESVQTVRKGEYIIIPPYFKHSLYTLSSTPFVNYWIHFDITPPYAHGRFNQIWDCEKGRIGRLPSPFMAMLENSFPALDNKRSGDYVLIKSLLTLLLFIENKKENNDFSEPLIPIEILDRCLDFIRREFSRPLSIEEICRECGVGRTALFSHFKKQLNCTPAAFIQTVRLQAVERLLKSTDYTIEQIAEKTGFTSPPSLYRCFKKVFGRSPARYRDEFTL